MENNVEETCGNKMNIANQYVQLERCRMAIAIVSSIKSDIEKMLFDILDTKKSLKDVELCEISQLHEIRKLLKEQIDSFANDINESWFLSEKELNAVRKYLNSYSEKSQENIIKCKDDELAREIAEIYAHKYGSKSGLVLSSFDECEKSAKDMANWKNKELLYFLRSLIDLTMNENIDALLLEINKKIEQLENKE